MSTINQRKIPMFQYSIRTLFVYTILLFTFAGSAQAIENSNIGSDTGRASARGADSVVSDEIKPFLGPRTEKIKERLRLLAKENPEEFEAFFDHIREIRQTQFAELKQTNPELFKKLKAEKNEKLQKSKENNPGRFKQILQHKNLNRKRHLKQLQKNNPEAFEALQNAPGETLRERIQYVKENQPELAEALSRGHRKAAFKEKWQNATPEERKEWAGKHPRAARYLKSAEFRKDQRQESRDGRRERRKKLLPNR